MFGSPHAAFVLKSLPLLTLFPLPPHLQEEDDGGELLGFNAVASKLLAVVTAPIHSALVSGQPQVRKQCIALKGVRTPGLIHICS